MQIVVEMIDFFANCDDEVLDPGLSLHNGDSGTVASVERAFD